MSMGLSGFMRGTAGSIIVALMALGCQGNDGNGGATEDVETVRGALSASGTTSAAVQLQVSKNPCATNVAQDYFKVTNATTAAIPLSQITIKYWINDTSTVAIAPAVWYSGCASGQPFAADAHFAVYVNGDLVTSQGAVPPTCRAPVPADGGV